MKIQAIILGFFVGINISKAQIFNNHEVETFLIEHTIHFNKNQFPIFCDNIDSRFKSNFLCLS